VAILLESAKKVPPYRIVRDWLGTKAVERLLAYAKSNADLFEDSDLGSGKERRIDHTVRISKTLDLGALRSEVRTKVRHLLPAMFETLGYQPFTPKFETELVAHGHGAFFARHIDTDLYDERHGSRRVISAVYYFHSMPKAFSGGALRIHSLCASGETGPFVDIAPDNDTLVFFPSWFPHEVLPIRCPSGQFQDSRFAINCWIHRS
jgi:SM-20-related protein